AYRLLIEEFGEGAVNLTEEGLIVYTNTYFYELLGLPYESVIGVEIFDFIDEASIDIFKKLFKDGLDGRSKGQVDLSVNDKTITVYISICSLRPALSTVGMIISDLTEKRSNEATIARYHNNLETANLSLLSQNKLLENQAKRLADKNLELERSNAELASFSYIASHDLQEPLRKIQTFSKRILDKAYDRFPENIKDYFERIISASNRMQKLINDVLNYSRADIVESVFVQSDLNLVVSDVIINLSELVEKSHAKIHYSNLPKLKIVPYQFHQLFFNLFSNAIKYSNPEIPMEIFVTAGIESIKRDDTSSLDSKCWHIEIKDNGIGFDNAYSEKIFELFQRLHSKDEYEGTGIGLALCKKIVQNHGGEIKACGTPGIGSVFHVYLPFNDQNEEQHDTFN
ncbi:MAG: ATP-binding protein, partial [Ferruginibacter sp.]